MNAIAYCHPFVPPEWIAAHGLRPCWLPCRAGDEPAVWVRRGVCPVAAARLDDFAGELPAEAVVLTTTCDQIRYAAALLQHQGRLPVFLLHVPRTWQTAAVRAFYREELSRLGRFLVACGGTSPTDDVLSQTMLRYDRARHRLAARQRCRPVPLHRRSPPSAAIAEPRPAATHRGGRLVGARVQRCRVARCTPAPVFPTVARGGSKYNCPTPDD